MSSVSNADDQACGSGKSSGMAANERVKRIVGEEGEEGIKRNSILAVWDSAHPTTAKMRKEDKGRAGRLDGLAVRSNGKA